MKAYGAKTGIQLAHAGRKATVDGEILLHQLLPLVQTIKHQQK